MDTSFINEIYKTNPECPPANIDCKRQRIKDYPNDQFETPAMQALNDVVANLIEPSKRVLEFGSGTGMLSLRCPDPKFFYALEYDKKTVDWYCKNRHRKNVTCSSIWPCTVGYEDDEDMKFDYFCAVDVIEHLENYGWLFKKAIKYLKPNGICILTTPNRDRIRSDAFNHFHGPPNYKLHVQEWTCSEFYFLGKAFFKHVFMFGLKREWDPETLCEMKIGFVETPLILVATRPWGN